jgi:hypothetical protein
LIGRHRKRNSETGVFLFFPLSIAPNFQQERSSLQLSIPRMFGDATLDPYKLDSETAGIVMPLAVVQLKSKRLFLSFLIN